MATRIYRNRLVRSAKHHERAAGARRLHVGEADEHRRTAAQLLRAAEATLDPAWVSDRTTIRRQTEFLRRNDPMTNRRPT
jgi:hypothetical protein